MFLGAAARPGRAAAHPGAKVELLLVVIPGPLGRGAVPGLAGVLSVELAAGHAAALKVAVVPLLAAAHEPAVPGPAPAVEGEDVGAAADAGAQVAGARAAVLLRVAALPYLAVAALFIGAEAGGVIMLKAAEAVFGHGRHNDCFVVDQHN
jgi:hypothetical protein